MKTNYPGSTHCSKEVFVRVWFGMVVADHFPDIVEEPDSEDE